MPQILAQQSSGELEALHDKIRKHYHEVTGQMPQPHELPTVLLENTIQFLLNIIYKMPGHVYWLDRNNVYLGCNEIQAKNAGLPTPQAILFKTAHEMMPKEIADNLNAFNDKIMQRKEPVKAEEFGVTGEHPQGGYYLSEKSPLMNEHGEVIGMLGVSLDITDRKAMEEQLKAKDFLQTQFIQNMQHDLRTPTSGAWSMLIHLAETEKDPVRREHLALVRDATKRIHEICTEIIDFDKIAQQKTPLIAKKFSIQHVVQGVVELNNAAAFNKHLNLGFTIDANIPTVVKGDAKRVSRMLVNLVGNAVKFTKTGSVSIRAKLIKMRDEGPIIQFEVKDTGIGIPHDKKDMIYEQFSRLTPSNEGYYRGTGLGLHIVKQYVDEMKGEIDLHSELGKGSTFYVTLPFEKPLVDTIYDEEPIESQTLSVPVKDEHFNFPSENIQNHSPTAQEGLRLLFIEDDPLALMAGLNALEVACCNIKTAKDVSTALQQLDETQFDLVISDLGLPDGTGNDIVKKVKLNPYSPNYQTPFLALTAHNDHEKMTQAKKAGFLHVMAKPLPKERVQTLIDAYVYKKDVVEAEQKMPTADELSVIDLELGKELAGNSEKLAWDLLHMLCVELPKDLLCIQEAYSINDVKKLRELFHKLKGGFCYCGVPRLQMATNNVHNAVKDITRVSDVEPLFTAFYTEGQLVVDAYKELKKNKKAHK